MTRIEQNDIKILIGRLQQHSETQSEFNNSIIQKLDQLHNKVEEGQKVDADEAKAIREELSITNSRIEYLERADQRTKWGVRFVWLMFITGLGYTINFIIENFEWVISKFKK